MQTRFFLKLDQKNSQDTPLLAISCLTDCMSVESNIWKNVREKYHHKKETRERVQRRSYQKQ